MSYTYGELRSAILDFTENQELSFVNNLDNFIKNAEDRLLKSVQLSLFRKNANAPITAGNKYMNVPSDFLAPDSLSMYDAQNNRFFLEYKQPSFIQSFNETAAQGKPRYYAQFDVNNFILAYVPDANYTAELHYLYRPQSLTAQQTNETSWLSENASLSLLYGALVEAYIYMKGEQDVIQQYDKRFNESLTGLKILGEAKQTTDQYRMGQLIRERQ